LEINLFLFIYCFSILKRRERKERAGMCRENDETLNSRIDNSHAGITEMFFEGLSLLLLPAFQREGNENYHFCIISESGNSSGVVLLGEKFFSL
jgi:hypothetical protein